MTEDIRGGSSSPELASIRGASDSCEDASPLMDHARPCIPAIFVHAGAGFHSQQNEHVHLKACVSAAEMGMKFLKSGATATEAVEAALKVLEDEEITNAGYGSNLSIDGTVECDATIVDHFGRSGACGAVPNIKNPISLAKLILDKSSQPLSLRRVPPNILVSNGARAFAEEHGIPLYPNEALISKSSRNRFLRWREDLLLAQEKEKAGHATGASSSPQNCTPCDYRTSPPAESRTRFSRDHAAAVLTGTWNEGQTDSPLPGTPAETCDTAPGYLSFKGASLYSLGRSKDEARIDSLRADTRAMQEHSLRQRRKISPVKSYAEVANRVDQDSPTRSRKRQLDRKADTNQVEGIETKKRLMKSPENHDRITDTIGAIAIDSNGLIAAGSSSGGIGMKHRGRLGPAALVGVGTAVVPEAKGDRDFLTVATVTSGTGEHMATTTASQRCAERLYHGIRLGRDGKLVNEDDEDAIMQSFILDDFMEHKGVQNCPSVGAIGVMAVKKCRGGIYFYFAHNTDSFALASMGGYEKAPRCVMSRLNSTSGIATGARKLKLN
ncbi:hypothetical protein VHEMI09502 [[Torrubiella] hemipterigena]|uniref:Threonine aspartase n=1 Tax=[Torrubiella] hemipterigena TaxID=1531966 RepID=A0A0A1TGI1_9HYPO|nr:hypothetical protein VHEMI09502 [[Torrubiella] hemipterigena]